MKKTSHFIWIELKAELFSDIFVNLYTYLKENNIADCTHFQNPLSPHITLYYLDKDLKKNDIDEIKDYIKKFDINKPIYISSFNYFSRWEWNRFVLFFTSNTDLPLKSYRDDLHKKYQRDFVEDNNFPFSPHITFLRIQDSEIYEKHRDNIEKIIKDELDKIKDIDLSSNKIFLYAVNSKFKEEIQVKM